jgi:hypothetical protein
MVGRGDVTIPGVLSPRSVSSFVLVALSLARVPGASAEEAPGGASSASGTTGTTGTAGTTEESAPAGESVDRSAAKNREEFPSRRVLTTRREDSDNPFRNSILTFDQSVTTQTVGLGPAPLSYVPLYELWLSLRPRYYFDEHWSLRGRFDYTKELTNNQPTTYYREDVFSDIWTDFVYGTKIDRLWRDTRVSAGLRALWPVSKTSRAAGTYLTTGAVVGGVHKFEINGEDASVFNLFRVGLTFTYLHAFSAATTPTSYGAFAYNRQNVDGLSFASDQLTGQTLAEHVFWSILDGTLQITPRLSLTGVFVTINEWHYPLSATHVGSVTVKAPTDDNQFVQNIWVLASVDYALFDELDLGLGYYNLANHFAANGQGRGLWGPDNIWWSPAARLFFDITANLDVLFDDARGAHKFAAKQASANARTMRVISELR